MSNDPAITNISIIVCFLIHARMDCEKSFILKSFRSWRRDSINYCLDTHHSTEAKMISAAFYVCNAIYETIKKQRELTRKDLVVYYVERNYVSWSLVPFREIPSELFRLI